MFANFAGRNRCRHSSQLRAEASGASNLVRSVLSLFVPTFISLLASAAIGIVDIYLSGMLGSAHQAAVGMADQVLFLITMLGAGLATASVAHICRLIGAGRLVAARLYARESILLGLITGLLSAIISFILAEPLIRIFHCEPSTSRFAIEYVLSNAPANAAYVLALCLVAILRALNRPLIGFAVWSVMSFLTIGLSLMFFYVGPGHLRSLSGLGLAWDIGSFSGVLLGLILLFQGDPLIRKYICDDFDGAPYRLKELLQTALPAMTAELAPVVSNFAIYRILSELQHSDAAQAAWTLRMKLEEIFATMPLVALSMAVAVVVGQTIGAGLWSRARLCAVSSCLFAMLAMLVVGFAITHNTDPIVGVFCVDDRTCRFGVTLLRPFGLTLPMMALSSILCASLDGAALTKIPMIIQSLGNLVVRCACAYGLLLANTGMSGFADATIVSAFFVAVFSVAAFIYFFREKSILRDARFQRSEAA